MHGLDAGVVNSEMSNTGDLRVTATVAFITTQEQLCALITPRGANRSYCRCSTQLGCAAALTLAPMPQYTRGTLNPRFLPRFCAHSPYGASTCTKGPGTHAYMSILASSDGPYQSLSRTSGPELD